MTAYLYGWPRKLGVLTLGLACVFMAAWIRSHFVCDHPYLLVGENYGEVVTIHDHICVHYLAFDSSSRGFFFKWKTWHDFKTLLDVFGDDFEWDFSLCGLKVCSMFDGRKVVLLVPYSYIVVPLTALTIPLLLTKPRPPNEAAETIKNELD